MTVKGCRQAVLLGEWRLLYRDPAAWLALGLLLTALLLALALGVLRERELAQSLAALAAADAARLEAATQQAIRLQEQGGEISRFRDPRLADVVGRRLAVQHLSLPSTGLAALAVGQSDLYPRWHPVSLEPRDRLWAEGELTHPRRLAVGRFDVSFVVVVLAPLLLLGLLSAIPAQERETGMLRFIAAQGSGPGRWLLGRALPRLLLLLLPILLLGALATLLGRGDSQSAGGDDLLRFLLWSAQVTLYLGFWAALALWVGTLPWDSARTSLALGGAWLAFVVLLPAVSQVALELSHPQPSRVAYVDAMREATDRARAEGSEALAGYLEDHPEWAGDDVDLDDFFAQRWLVQQRVEAELAPLSASFEAQREARARWAAWMRLASPALLTMDALADAAGTGAERHGHFIAQVYDHHDAWRAFFVPRLLAAEPFFEHQRVPRFDYEAEPLGGIGRRALLTGLLTAAFAGLFGLLALLRCRSLPKVLAIA